MKRWLSGAFTVLAWSCLALLILLIGYRWVGMPQTKGELILPGLSKPVTVLRDGFSVPHIYAESEADAHFTLGFVHAQDRLWQLELSRRLVNGQLAEVLGAAALPIDRLTRTLGIAVSAQAAWAELDANSRTQVSAYVQGLNSGIERAQRKFWLQSPEFWLLNTRPNPWREADVVGLTKMLAWEQSTNHSSELLRLALTPKLDHRQLGELFDLPAGVLNAAHEPLYRGLARKALSLLPQLPLSHTDGIGSNHWLVASTRSADARPMLANDPHVSLRAPASWYLAHLSAPGLEVIGATMPGLPVVLVGRTDRLAWGLTNHGADIQDIYIERLNPGNGLEYQTPQGWAKFDVRDETIAVKGAAPIKLSVRQSRHGPIVSDALANAERAVKAVKIDSSYVLSLAWTGLDRGEQTLGAWLQLNRAKSATELLAAAALYSSVPLNLLYADVEGKTGMVVIGAIPRRNPASELRGAMPAPGWEAKHDWQGRIAFAELPKQVAREGIISNANERWQPENYRHDLGVDWTLPHRQVRAEQLLRAKPKHDVHSLSAIQGDVGSTAMRSLMPLLLTVSSDDPTLKSLLARMAQWDGAMAADRPEPLLASAWVDQLYRLLFADELGDELLDVFFAHRMRTNVLFKVLSRPEQAGWCDRIDTPAAETCDTMIAEALSRAVNQLRASYGDKPDSWRWGRAHEAVSEHQPFSRHRWLSKVFDVRVATGGDASTLNAGRTDPANKLEPFATRHGASYRGVYDLADPNKSLFILSTGQSGHLLSGHYRDLANRWARLEYLPMVTGKLEVERLTAARLTLNPSPSP